MTANHFLSRFAFSLLFIVDVFNLADAQVVKHNDFYQVDSLARATKYKKDIYRLTGDLTEPFNDDISKARAIFVWITDNIAYDYKFVNKGKKIKIPDCPPGRDCRQFYNEWESKFLSNVIRKGKATCAGYSYLFKKMCEVAGLRCEIVDGYTKQRPFQIGTMGSLNHAWNAVWLNSSWQFLDVTWASGSCGVDEDSDQLTPFRKNFEEYFWLTPFPELSRNHYPKDPKWVEKGYTTEWYKNNPYYASHIIPKLKLHSPGAGILEVNKGDTIHFKLEYEDKIQFLQLNTNIFRNLSIFTRKNISKRHYRYVIDTLALKKQKYVPFRQTGKNFEFDYVVNDASLYYIEVLFDYHAVLRFKIKVRKEE